VTPEEAQSAKDSTLQILEHIKSAKEALKVPDLNMISWYLELIEKHGDNLRKLFENVVK